MAHEYPKAFARFYDTIYHALRDDTDHQFFMDKIAATNEKILEIGVGTGRFFMDTLHAGADIYGIDVSPEIPGDYQGNPLSKDSKEFIVICKKY